MTAATPIYACRIWASRTVRRFYKAEGVSNYHALQFGLRKRLSHGLQVSAAYTWSHALDMQSGLGLFFNGNDPFNLHNSYATSSYDRTHVAVCPIPLRNT